MYNKKLLALPLAWLLGTFSAFAQEQPEMADVMRENGKIYVVVAVVVVIFLVLFIYLITIDRKLKQVERKLEEKKG